ncbi:hypothetical protein OROMI_013217 [Orobanche minor]
MASSQTSSHSQKRDQIIDGRLFSHSTVMNRIRTEVEDDDSMERIISKLEEQGLHRLGRSHIEMYDEHIVEEIYRIATVKALSRKHGGGKAVHGVNLSSVRAEFIESVVAKFTFDEAVHGVNLSSVRAEFIESVVAKFTLGKSHVN